MDPEFEMIAAELAEYDNRSSQRHQEEYGYQDALQDQEQRYTLDSNGRGSGWSQDENQDQAIDGVPSPSPAFRFQPVAVPPTSSFHPDLRPLHRPVSQHQPAFASFSSQRSFSQPSSFLNTRASFAPPQTQTQQQHLPPPSLHRAFKPPPSQPQPFRLLPSQPYVPQDRGSPDLGGFSSAGQMLGGKGRGMHQPRGEQQRERKGGKEDEDEFDDEFGDGSELVGVDARASNPNRSRPKPLPPPQQQQNASTSSRVQQQLFQQSQLPRTGSNGRKLVPVSSLPDRYRALFKFGVFNAVQSRCFETALKSDENLVVSSPTGSGKTVLFELTIIRLLESGDNGKAVYIAPTKALCAERTKDWNTKFAGIGVRCAQLTGDTEWTAAGFKDINDSRVIVTTPEKWDSVTRWKGQKQESRLLSNLALFLIDEVHILHEKRGATLEVLVSRMKSLGTRIRFVALSATAPNIADVGTWLRPNKGSSESIIVGSELEKLGSAKVFTFDDSYRPCHLKRVIVPVPKKGGNDWVWMKSLEFRVFDLLLAHGENAPSLVFCPTRKGSVACAEQLGKQYREAIDKRDKLPWSNTKSIGGTFADKALQLLASVGIAFHHGGMSYEDRQLVEKSFLTGSIKVICSTSTLAVGVNLPAHTVVVLGTKQFTGSRTEEYTSIDITQMIGRAGRPQFDRTGVAIIVTEPALQQRYEQLTSGGTILESKLHENLVEHINSEIALHTINNVAEAQTWLRSSFLYIRILQNPRHYIKAFGETSAPDASPAQILDSFAQRALSNLEETGLISMGGEEGEEEGKVGSTELGDVMSRTFIKYETMRKLKNLPPQATLRQVLETLCDADEFDEIRLRTGEKAAYKKLGQSEEIRFPIKKIDSTKDKVFVLFQAICAGLSITDFKTEGQPLFESLTIFRHSARIAKAIVEVALMKESGSLVKNALEILRAVNSKCWERGAVIFKQIDKLGEKSIKILSQSGVTTFDELAQDPSRIERLLNRHPPFGSKIVESVRALPTFSLSVEEVSVTSDRGESPVEVVLECTMGVTVGSMMKKTGWNQPLSVSSLVTTSEGRLVDFRRSNARAFKKPVSFQVTALLKKPSETITVAVSCNEIAGVGAFANYHPQVSPTEYPIPDVPFEPSEVKEGQADEENPDPSHKPGPRKIASKTPVDGEAHEHERLENGRYKCGHNCKDKTACRHLCCREGSDKPPRPKKAAAETDAPDTAASKKASVISKLAKTKVEADKADDLLDVEDEFPDLADLLSGQNQRPRASTSTSKPSTASKFSDTVSSNNSAYRDDELDAILAARSPSSLQGLAVSAGRSTKQKQKRKLDDIEEDVDDLLPPTWGGFNGSDDSSLDLTLPRGRQRQHEQRDQHQPKAKLARFTYRSPSPVPSIPTQSSPVFPLPPIQSFPSVSQTAKQSTGTGRQRPPLFLSGSASDIEDLLPTPSTAQSRRVRKEKEKRKNGAWIDAGLLDDDGEEVDEPMESLPSRPAKSRPALPRSALPPPPINRSPLSQPKSQRPDPAPVQHPMMSSKSTEDEEEEEEDPMDIFGSVKIVG